MEGKRLRIPDEDIKLNDAEVAVLHTKTFQRLFLIKQLGLAYLIYPAATHTRGAHSLQTMHEAAKILKALGLPDDSQDVQDVRMAALLHDIGHVPFGHTLEDEHPILDKHDRPGRVEAALAALKKELDPAVAKLVDRAAPILENIGGKDKPADWRADIVGNTVCADLLAYINADAKWTGIEKRPGAYRVYDYFQKHNNRLCVSLTKGGLRVDIVSAIIDLLDMRYALTERVIYHHAKCVAGAMLGRAARLANLKEAPELLTMGDEGFLQYLRQQAGAAKATGATRLLDCIESRRLYKRIFKLGDKARDAWDDGAGADSFCNAWRDGNKVEGMLSAVEDEHNLPRGSLALWCPPQDSSMKLARVQVVWDTAKAKQGPAELRSPDVARQFPGVHKRVQAIEEQYLGLWTFWVAIDPEHIDKAPSVVRSLEEKIGVNCDPTFIETYLKAKYPKFQEGMGKTHEVTKVLQSMRPQVQQSISEVAGLRGKGVADSKTILSSISAVANNKLSAKNAEPSPPPSGPSSAKRHPPEDPPRQ